MYYNFDLEYKINYHRLMKGIYKITIGNKFYIGQAWRLAVRRYQHSRSIIRCLNEYPELRPYDIHYLDWVRYIHENPQIKTGTIEIIQRCITGWGLYYAENKYLQDIRTNPDCLNNNFYQTKRFADNEMWDVEVDDHTLLAYFDPRDPATRYGAFQRLTAQGEIWKRKPTKKELQDIQQLLSSPHPDDTTP